MYVDSIDELLQLYGNDEVKDELSVICCSAHFKLSL